MEAVITAPFIFEESEQVSVLLLNLDSKCVWGKERINGLFTCIIFYSLF